MPESFGNHVKHPELLFTGINSWVYGNTSSTSEGVIMKSEYEFAMSKFLKRKIHKVSKQNCRPLFLFLATYVA
jgi:hypothetical protein